MGLFDYVNVEISCPSCGKKLSGFQSKDSYCEMDLIDPTEVCEFYSDCDCGAWIEFSRRHNCDEEPKHRSEPYTLEEIKELGFSLKEDMDATDD